MPISRGITKELTEEVYGVHEGDVIRITKLDDPFDHSYPGRDGVVTYIDGAGQLHGDWGSLAVIPGVDGFEVIKKKEETSDGQE